MNFKTLSEEDIKNMLNGQVDICDLLENQKPNAFAVNNAKLFFDSDDNEGYFIKQEFQPYLSTLNDDERRKFKLCLEYMSKRIRLNSLPIKKRDRNNRPYMWLKFQLPNAVQEFKLIVGGKLDLFVQHYQQGLIQVGFDLNALYIEAQTES